MVKRLVAATLVALVMAAAPAAAQQYPPAENSLIISDTTPTPGQTIDIRARTFVAGSTVTVTLSESVQLGTPAADGAGVANLSATIPASTPLGAHTIVATGTGADGAPLTLTASITVVSAEGSGTGSGSGSLPRTGDDSSIPLARIGLALAAAGGVITAVAAKRRKAAAAA